MNLEIRPLSEALGAEVLGGNFAEPLSAAEVEQLNSAFLAYHLLCLRGTPLSPKAFFQIASYFGTPFTETTRKHWVSGSPEISRLELVTGGMEQTPTPDTLLLLPSGIRIVGIESWARKLADV